MATMEKAGFGEKTNEEIKQEEAKVNKLTEEEMKLLEEETKKEGFFKRTGKWCLKELPGFLVGAGLTVGAFLLGNLFGKDDDDEPAAIEAPVEETKE